MKNAWKKVVVVLALLGASSLLSARAAVSVYAEETETSSNAVVATAEAAVASNAPAATTHGAHRTSSDADQPPVRIDETGIHVGGANPVDINVPYFTRHGGERMIGLVAILIPIVAIVSTFGMPVAIIAIALFFRHRRNRMTHETLRAMIEKGMPVTPELVAQLRSRNSVGYRDGGSRGGLLPGLVLTGIGTALLISDHGHSKGGWIVLFIGVAFLIVWSVERKNQNNGQPPR